MVVTSLYLTLTPVKGLSPETVGAHEVNVDISYSETVHSGHSFMDWNHIPDFDSIYRRN